MDPEATGWDNIIFRCVFLGMSFREARAMAPSIAEFTELGSFLDLPVRTYSQGMFVRLAFAISTTMETEITIMDEMIGAGDAAFLHKAQRRIAEVMERTKILILASHNPSVLQEFCNRACWMERGRIRGLGPPKETIEAYLQSVGAPSHPQLAGKNPAAKAS
jgi:ABC-type polysaccharide/polyol phosphate transport system ATPase subunit